jgi:hypothetical protein
MCFFCWSQQKPFHIAHIADMEEDILHSYPYLPENRYNVLYTVLLCGSCHMKIDNTWRHESPFYLAFMKAFRERKQRIESQPQQTIVPEVSP